MDGGPLINGRRLENVFDLELHPHYAYIPFKLSAIVRWCSYSDDKRVVCVLNEDYGRYLELADQMNKRYNAMSALQVIYRAEKGRIYAARIESQWHRVRVDEVYHMERERKDRVYRVVLIDEGSSHNITGKELFVLDKNFIGPQYGQGFGISFHVPKRGLTQAPFMTDQELSCDDEVEIFVLSDEEPFLAGFIKKNGRVLWEELTSGFDSKSASIWKKTFSNVLVEKCRGVLCGSYPSSVMPADISFEATIAAFESLDRVYIRDPEQSLRLLHLENRIKEIYANERLRSELVFEHPRFLFEGIACVAWNNAKLRWERARIAYTSADGTVVDAVSIDYPASSLRSLKFNSREILMIRADLLFAPMCYCIRVAESADQFDMLIRWSKAREVLRIGAEVHVCMPASSTLTEVKLSNKISLDVYINIALQMSDRQQATDSGLGNDNTIFSQSLSMQLGAPRFKRNLVSRVQDMVFPGNFNAGIRSFSSSMDLRNDVTQAPHDSAYVLSKKECHISPHTQLPANVQCRAVTSTPIALRRGSPKIQPIDEGGAFRVPEIPRRFKQRPSKNAKAFENDYLNKTLTSCDSDTDAETFSRSFQRMSFQKPGESLSSSACSSLFENVGSFSDLEGALCQREIPVRVINANNPLEIYLETAETKRRMERLRGLLDTLKRETLLPIQGKWAIPNNVVLYDTGKELQRVRIVSVKNEETVPDDITLVCIDTGEEHYVDSGTGFFRIPRGLDNKSIPASCIGPVRLSGQYGPKWLSVSAGIKLRELCENVVLARYEGSSSERYVVLFNVNHENINDLFMQYIDSECKEVSL